MSQSPVDDFSPRALVRYRQGWRALNRLLHQDRSFSGRERNCAFLNTRDGRFADISAASGLDFLDDARAVCTADWDFDGDLDLWVTNRTAPRLRFLLNRAEVPGRRFVALRLEGDGAGTNRDAVGARVELHTGGGGAPMIKTVHAGDGFLAQSSSWLHFGLGAAAVPGRLTVRWPGGAAEDFAGVEPGHFYRLRQGSGRAVRWEPPAGRSSFATATATGGGGDAPPPDSGAARIVLNAPLPLPALDPRVESAAGEGGLRGPLLLNVWASWCAPCMAELKEWSARGDEFRRRGLRVLALNAEGAAGGDGGDGELPAAAAAVLAGLRFPFPSASAAPGDVLALDLFQRAVLDRWQPLPVPSSFLLDHEGRVAVIYKGRVELEQVFRDLDLLGAPPEVLRAAATPFSGRWISVPPGPEPLRLCNLFIDHAEVPAAVAYLRRFAETVPEGRGAELADIYYVLGLLLGEEGERAGAIDALRVARRHNPGDVRVRGDLGRLLAEGRELEEAEAEFGAALAINPADPELRRQLALVQLNRGKTAEAIAGLRALHAAGGGDATTHFHLATALRRSGDFPAAVEAYRDVLRRQPAMAQAANNLAWISAAHPDPILRDPAEAVRLAEEVCRRTGHRNPSFLDTLAVAYAAAGRFDDAVSAAERALQILGPRGEGSGVARRLDLFRQNQPYREAAWGKPGPAPEL